MAGQADRTDEIRRTVTETFRKVFRDPALTVTDQTTAPDVKGWDSLTHVRLLVQVEKAFKIRFDTTEVADFKTVGDLIRLVAEKTA